VVSKCENINVQWVFSGKKQEKQIKITYVYKCLRAEPPCEIHQFVCFPFFSGEMFCQKAKKRRSENDVIFGGFQ
jgi:hypothetical protein